jgi:hypothetical protein
VPAHARLPASTADPALHSRGEPGGEVGLQGPAVAADVWYGGAPPGELGTQGLPQVAELQRCMPADGDGDGVGRVVLTSLPAGLDFTPPMTAMCSLRVLAVLTLLPAP